MAVRSKWQSLPTEAINPSTLAIDKLSSADIVEGMLNEDRKMLAAVQREKERISVGVDIITQALRKGGRIIFVGAGTSGRLGILESAEMPPTFGTSSDLVLAIAQRHGVDVNARRSRLLLRRRIHVAVADAAEGGGPCIGLEAVQIRHRFTHVFGLHPAERRQIAVGAPLRLLLEFGEIARAGALCKRTGCQ